MAELDGVADLPAVLTDKTPFDQQHGFSHRALHSLRYPLGGTNSTDFNIGVIVKGIHLRKRDIRQYCITDHIYLSQDDIRQVQMAKGAIYTGVFLMAKQLGLEISDIQQVQLAGAFGSYLSPASACRIGLLPEKLHDRIKAVGNAAGSGAKLLACDKDMLTLTQELIKRIEFLELASLPEFPITYAKSMNFREKSK